MGLAGSHMMLKELHVVAAAMFILSQYCKHKDLLLSHERMLGTYLGNNTQSFERCSQHDISVDPTAVWCSRPLKVCAGRIQPL